MGIKTLKELGFFALLPLEPQKTIYNLCHMLALWAGLQGRLNGTEPSLTTLAPPALTSQNVRSDSGC